jgi:hypothetical protein
MSGCRAGLIHFARNTTQLSLEKSAFQQISKFFTLSLQFRHIHIYLALGAPFT